MPADLQMELWRALVSSSLLVLMALVAYVVSVLTRMKSEQDIRAKDNKHRDAQRDEVQENVRRLAEPLGLHSENPDTPPSSRPGAVDYATRPTLTVVTTDPPPPRRGDHENRMDSSSGESSSEVS
jgi:hypothetical protein